MTKHRWAFESDGNQCGFQGRPAPLEDWGRGGQARAEDRGHLTVAWGNPLLMSIQRSPPDSAMQNRDQTSKLDSLTSGANRPTSPFLLSLQSRASPASPQPRWM